MENIFHKIKLTSDKFHKLVIDCLFPVSCISCGKGEKWICEKCFSRVQIQTEHVCPVCEKMITPDGKTCLACKRKSKLSGLIVASSYKNDLVSRAVHFFKYRFIEDLHGELGELMTNAILETELQLPDAIIPIPLHHRRLRWRGFNQAALLATYISKNLLAGSEITVCENVLTRNRYTTPQMGIKNHTERQENIAGAFLVSDKEQIKNKTILLVDDIATTGSTIFECARVLKEAGSSEVFAIVIARQSN